jgi:hypothetical protein
MPTHTYNRITHQHLPNRHGLYMYAVLECIVLLNSSSNSAVSSAHPVSPSSFDSTCSRSIGGSVRFSQSTSLICANSACVTSCKSVVARLNAKRAYAYAQASDTVVFIV